MYNTQKIWRKFMKIRNFVAKFNIKVNKAVKFKDHTKYTRKSKHKNKLIK